MGEAGGPIKVTWRLQRRFSLAARHRFFGQAPKKWGRMAGQGNDPHPTYRRTRTKPPTSTSPAPSRAKMSKYNRGSSAHANGGATRVKKALFFGGSTPFLWASTKEMGSNGRTSHRPPPNVSAHTHTATKRKGGTPGEGSPLDPLLRFCEHKGGSALCGARPEALPLDSTTFEKVDETFKRASRSGQTAEATEAMSTGTNQSSR